MKDSISFLPKQALQRSKRRSRPVQSGFATQQLMTQTVLWHDGERLLATVEIGTEEEQPLAEIGGAIASGSNPVAVFRMYRILDELPRLSDHLALGAMMAADRLLVESLGKEGAFAMAVGFESMDPKALVTEVRTLLGEKAYVAIMKEVPPDLDQLLRYMKEKGSSVAISALVREVDEGNLAPTAYQKSLGINHSEVLKRRDARVLEDLQRLKPFFTALTGADKHAPGCNCLDILLNEAVSCALHGITDDAEIVGMSMLRNLEKRALGLDLISLFLSRDTASDERATQGRIRDLAAALVADCPTIATEPEAYYRTRLETLRQQWTSLPLAIAE